MRSRPAPSDPPSIRWRMRAPPPVRPSVEQAGLSMLAEGDDDVAHLLWRSLRTVLDWAETPPARRGGLFPDGAYERRLAAVLTAQLPPQLAEALSGTAAVLAPAAQPAAVLVAGHCSTVATWAEAQGRPATALAFCEGAALCCPHHAPLALRAGRLARDQALHALAESWLARAVAVARQAGDWDTYARAHVASGKMMTERGALPAARRYLRRAERRAARHALHAIRAMALHDLFAVEVNAGNLAAAYAHAQDALASYPAGDRGLAFLSFDLAFVWMEQGHFGTALTVFRSLLPRIPASAHPHIHGAIARAAGACGLLVEHRRAVSVLRQLPVSRGTSEAWLDAARGAATLAHWEEAAAHASLALELARERREHRVAHLAEEFLPYVQLRQRPTPPASTEAEESAVQELAMDVLETLERASLAGSAA